MGTTSFTEDYNYGHSMQLRLDIARFEYLEELTICEGRAWGDPFDEMVPFFALVDWHDSFRGGSQSLKRLRLYMSKEVGTESQEIVIFRD